MKQFTAGKNEQGVRLSRFVQSVTTGLPNSVLYKSFRNKRIKVNGKRGDADTRLNEGDVIALYINDEFFADAPQRIEKPAQKPMKTRPLSVVFEDDNIAVLYKPAHLLCHSDRTGDDSLVERFQAYLIAKGEYDPSAENTFAPAICNRLDRGTQGLVLAAKNYAALRDLNAIIRDDLLLKQYECITVSMPPKGLHTAYLSHHEKTNKVTVRKDKSLGYKEIRTGVAILNAKPPFALCEIDLHTGRTHQIRAHLAFLGAPILGDIKYGSKKMNDRYQLRTQALCACKVTFREIPKENTLHYLSSKCIALPENSLRQQFENL